MTVPLNASKLRDAREFLHSRWGWFVAIGLLLVVLGLLAAYHVFTATVVSVIFIATLMLLGGLGMLIQAWRLKGWGSFFLWSISGLLYIAAGLLAFYKPLLGAALLTLLLGATLLGSGVFRLWVWIQNRAQRGWAWLAFSGLLSVAAGLAIAIGWPHNSVWLLGMLLAFDLMFQGWTLVMLGLTLRQRI